MMEKSMLRIAGTLSHSYVNGPGIRYCIFTQGCPHHCTDCQNPETWDLSGGQEIDANDIIRDILTTKHLQGITLSGGDPFIQPKPCADIAAAAKQNGLDVWCYTGFTWERLLEMQAENQDIHDLLISIDVLVDGKFDKDLMDGDHIYRGSSNQRLIDVTKSISKNEATLMDIH